MSGVMSRGAALQEAQSTLQPQVSILAAHTTSVPSESLIFTSQGRHFPQLIVCLPRAEVPIHATEQHRHCGTPASGAGTLRDAQKGVGLSRCLYKMGIAVVGTGAWAK